MSSAGLQPPDAASLAQRRLQCFGTFDTSLQAPISENLSSEILIIIERALVIFLSQIPNTQHGHLKRSKGNARVDHVSRPSHLLSKARLVRGYPGATRLHGRLVDPFLLSAVIAAMSMPFGRRICFLQETGKGNGPRTVCHSAPVIHLPVHRGADSEG